MQSEKQGRRGIERVVMVGMLVVGVFFVVGMLVAGLFFVGVDFVDRVEADESALSTGVPEVDNVPTTVNGVASCSRKLVSATPWLRISESPSP